ncbi:unnamed protein product [Discula destructiva]
MDSGNREEELLGSSSSWDPGAGPGPRAPATTSLLNQNQHSPSDKSHHDDLLVPTQLSPARQQYRYPDDLERYHALPIEADDSPVHYDPSFGLSAAAYAADNFHAVNSNATVNTLDGSPDDFYRGYQSRESAPQGLIASPAYDSMASVVSSNRQPPSSRSTINATPNKPPVVPGTRTATRPNYRSASNPVDDRITDNGPTRLPAATGSANPATAKGTVSDMKKKFEQNAGAGPSLPEPRRVASRTGAAKDGAARPVYGRSATIGTPQSYSSLRTTGTDSPRSSQASATQRSKFVPEDHISSNSQSFASRISRPKPPIASKPPHTTRSSASLTKQASFPLAATEGPLLFGEIRQELADAETPGHGIEDGAPPGQVPVSGLQRSQSDAHAKPGSPTDWYRGASTRLKNGTQTAKPSPTKPHGRSQSELAPIDTATQTRRRVEQSPSPHSSSSSRLPVVSKKLATPSNSASPASTRSNSPAGMRRPPPNGRPPRQQSTPTTRAKTPVSRAKTPNGSSTARKTPASSANGSRLATVVSPPPKQSPPLRSSRPRQPVSEATTASSRLKASDHGRSKSPTKAPGKPSAHPSSRQETSPAARRRKLSVTGPVDFAQRRETIKLKYTKTIRETEAKQARDAAAERRKKELEAAAKAKVRAQARAEAQIAAAEAEAAARASEPVKSTAVKDAHSQEEIDVEHHDDDTQVVDATAASPDRAKPPALSLDSPTLGLPGTFPSFGSPQFHPDEAPPSAVSETSAVTEFDNEAQTEPPVPELTAHQVAPEQPPQIDGPQVDPLPSPPRALAHETRATYRDPFEDITDDESIPIKIALEPSSPHLAPRDTSAWITAQADPPVPGAFTEDHDMVSVSECDSQHHSEYQAELLPETCSQPEVEQTVEPKTDSQTAARDEYEPEPFVPQPYHPTTRTETESQTVIRDEYEPPPFVPQPYRSTTVTIISRDRGYGPPTFAEQERADSMPPPNEPQMDSLEDFYTGPRLKDNVASLRDSTFTMSDADISDGRSGSGEAQRTPDTSNSLNVPSMTTPANRSSQQSMWTDLSYSSRDSRRLDYRSDADESRPQSFADDSSSSRHRYFVDNSGHVQSEEFRHEQTGPYRVAEPDTRRKFSGSYAPGAERVPPHALNFPDHSPPPPPPLPTQDESRPASGLYDDYRPDSTMTKNDFGTVSFTVSRRDSDEYSHAASSPHSLTSANPAQTPVEGERKLSEDASEETGPAKKERSRLRQRELCIKELVDTEAVFVRDMNVVEEIYKGTAEACPELNDKDIKMIFRNTREIIAFHTTFLSELKDGVASVYVPRGKRSPLLKDDTTISDANTIHSVASTAPSTVPSTAASSVTAMSIPGTTVTNGDTDDSKDRQTIIGPAFARNIEQMRTAHEGFLRTSDVASKRLIELQQITTVQVWLNECNEVARDLTAAWNLDSLLIKPMQRITKYPNLIMQLLQYTPEDHPDREGLVAARVAVENAILEINKTKKNFELVGQIVGRKRKDTDVKAGFARAFGKRVDKLQASSNRPPEDPEYLKLNEKFSDDYLRLQVVLRDVEFYTRQVSAYVQTFLDHLSAMELVMRLQPGPHPELEAKWVQFNVSMRDIKTVALDQHLFAIRKHVIEPFELVIRSYQNPLLAMKKRGKRRLDYEKSVQVKKSGKKMDKQLTELVEHYEALNDTLLKELPQLSALTEKVGNICLGNMINIQAKWWLIWQEKIRGVAGITEVREISEIVTNFQRDFKEEEEKVMALGILNQTIKPRPSFSTMDDSASTMSRMDSTMSTKSMIRSRPSDPGTPRLRAASITSDQPPVLPTPDFGKSPSSAYAISPTPAAAGNNSVSYFYRDYYSGITSRGPASPASSDFSNPTRSVAAVTTRPGTGRSYDSQGILSRPSIDSASTSHLRRESYTTTSPPLSGTEGQRHSGLFQSALPLTETAEEPHRGRSSRGSSRERHITKGYNVLWLAASLFEFNIETTKHEAGYPYLTYTAGEIFDVIAEKGELWLAKNQDDPSDLVGWIWSKHFAKLADS